MGIKQVYAFSDEGVVQRWTENTHARQASGERHFRHALPCGYPPNPVCRHLRVGEEGCEWLLARTIEAAKAVG